MMLSLQKLHFSSCEDNIMSISKVILGVLILSASLTAATLNVPEDYPTIQSAIDAGQTGDTVLVAPGV